jgi:hypothetical protein
VSADFFIRDSFLETSHVPHNVDYKFYKSLGAAARWEMVDPKTRCAIVPVPGPKQTGVAIITAILSSTVLSSAIEAWLKVQSTRIEITVERNNIKQTVVFDGPNLKETREDIERVLNELSAEDAQCEARIEARKKQAL